MTAKKICFLFLSLVCFFSTKAQYYNIAIGPELNIPSGNSANVSTIGIGGALKAEIGLQQKFALTANGSIVSFFGQKYFGFRTPTETSVPLKVGFKYYSSSNFYLEGQIGTNIPISENANMGFVWSPGIGSYINLKNSKNKLDVGLRYEGWSSRRAITATTSTFSTFGFIGLRVAYALNLY